MSNTVDDYLKEIENIFNEIRTDASCLASENAELKERYVRLSTDYTLARDIAMGAQTHAVELQRELDEVKKELATTENELEALRIAARPKNEQVVTVAMLREIAYALYDDAPRTATEILRVVGT